MTKKTFTASDEQLMTEEAINKHLNKWIRKSYARGFIWDDDDDVRFSAVKIHNFTLTKNGNVGLKVTVPTIKDYSENSNKLGKPHPLNTNLAIQAGDPTTTTTVIVVPPTFVKQLIEQDYNAKQRKRTIKKWTGFKHEHRHRFLSPALSKQLPSHLQRLKQTKQLQAVYLDTQSEELNDTAFDIYIAMKVLQRTKKQVSVKEIAEVLNRTTTNVRYHLNELIKLEKIIKHETETKAYYSTGETRKQDYNSRKSFAEDTVKQVNLLKIVQEMNDPDISESHREHLMDDLKKLQLQRSNYARRLNYRNTLEDLTLEDYPINPYELEEFFIKRNIPIQWLTGDLINDKNEWQKWSYDKLTVFYLTPEEFNEQHDNSQSAAFYRVNTSSIYLKPLEYHKTDGIVIDRALNKIRNETAKDKKDVYNHLLVHEIAHKVDHEHLTKTQQRKWKSLFSGIDLKKVDLELQNGLDSIQKIFYQKGTLAGEYFSDCLALKILKTKETSLVQSHEYWKTKIVNDKKRFKSRTFNKNTDVLNIELFLKEKYKYSYNKTVVRRLKEALKGLKSSTKSKEYPQIKLSDFLGTGKKYNTLVENIKNHYSISYADKQIINRLGIDVFISDECYDNTRMKEFGVNDKILNVFKHIKWIQNSKEQIEQNELMFNVLPKLDAFLDNLLMKERFKEQKMMDKVRLKLAKETI